MTVPVLLAVEVQEVAHWDQERTVVGQVQEPGVASERKVSCNHFAESEVGAVVEEDSLAEASDSHWEDIVQADMVAAHLEA